MGMGTGVPFLFTSVTSTAVPQECWDGAFRGFATKESFLPEASYSFH